MKSTIKTIFKMWFILVLTVGIFSVPMWALWQLVHPALHLPSLSLVEVWSTLTLLACFFAHILVVRQLLSFQADKVATQIYYWLN